MARLKSPGTRDEDLKSIYAVLRTITPITNHVPDYQSPCDPDEK